MPSWLPEGNTPLPGDNEQRSLWKINDANGGSGGGGGGGGAAQMYEYTTTDPTTDGVVPAAQGQPAVAYHRTGAGAVFTWDTVAHVWR